MDQKAETGDILDDGSGWEKHRGEDSERASKVPSPIQQTEPEPQPEPTDEVATTAEDEFDWANTTRRY